MKVRKDLTGEPNDCIGDYLNFEDYGDDSSDEVMFYGYGSWSNPAFVEEFKDYKRRIFLQLEHPSGFNCPPALHQPHIDLMDYFTELCTVCPYTGKWLDLIKGTDKYRVSTFSHNLEYAVQGDVEKDYDTIVWGNVHHQEHIDILNAIARWKHSFYTQGYGTHEVNHLITIKQAPRIVMWERLRRTKVMVCSNLLYLQSGQYEGTKTIPRWEENEAWSHLDDGIIPQIKTRPIEAMFNKTLVLIRKDPWNVLARFFTPDEDFIYYEGIVDLEDKLADIVNHWDDYVPIVEHAYEKATSLHNTEVLFQEVHDRSLSA